VGGHPRSREEGMHACMEGGREERRERRGRDISQI
jgi:hypothetical protein